MIFWLLLLIAPVLGQRKRMSLPEELHAATCVDFLNSIYQFGSCQKSDSTCLCSSDAFLPTTISCINQLVQLDEGDASVTAEAQDGLKKLCKTSNFTTYFNQSFFLEPYKGNITGVTPGSWKTSKPFKPTTTEVKNAFKTYKASLVGENRVVRTGAGLLAYWLGFFVLHTIFFWFSTMCPSWYRKLIDNSMCKYFRKWIGLPSASTYFPPMIYTIAIAGFTILSLVFSFAYLPYATSTNYKYSYDGGRAYSTAVGIRSGFLSIYVMPLMIIFAGRNNFLQSVTGMSQDLFISLHRWVGRVVVILVLIHSFAFTAAWVYRGTYGSVWKRAYWKWGIVGTAFGCFLCFQAARPFRRRAYETFLVLHIIGAIFFLIGGYYHLEKIHEYEALYCYYASFAVWGFERFVRILRILASNFGQKATIKYYGDTLILTTKLPKWWRVPQNPGMYAYIHFFDLRYFWQSHPFTVFYEGSDLKLVIRVKTGITEYLKKKLEAAGGEMTMRIALDGPYGHSKKFDTYENVIFVSGGAGVTAPYAYLQTCKTNMTFFWAVRDRSYLDWFANEIEFMENSDNIDLNVHCSNSAGDNADEEKNVISWQSAGGGDVSTENSVENSSENSKNPSSNESDEKNKIKENVSSSRLDVFAEVSSKLLQCKGDTAVFCCGPEGVNLAARNAVIKSLTKTDIHIDYFEESFSW